ncbi:hypothetical protein G7Y89_g7875 [Cudoniella acicularis]|uniref:Plant heme peroxidase family profile domain-containing protein n=1 Tax=Cudoniella acicularis TaxID=354080 RepID=A0A8H4W1M3_9HELO|nr:hypothetical protein G7Y89_g7875 [Cudoniella acicularis]
MRAKKPMRIRVYIPRTFALVGSSLLLSSEFPPHFCALLPPPAVFLSLANLLTNLLDIGTVWSPIAGSKNELYIGKNRTTGAEKWVASRADLVFGSHAELRAISEVYAEAGGQDQLVSNFVAAWVKVMDLDRFDVKK